MTARALWAASGGFLDDPEVVPPASSGWALHSLDVSWAAFRGLAVWMVLPASSGWILDCIEVSSRAALQRLE